MYKILFFRGDGIGPEVAEQAVKIIRKLGQTFHLVFEIQDALAGGVSIDKHGVPITEEALNAAKKADAVFLGAVGGPKWDPLEAAKRPEKALLSLRKSLDVFANLRPIKVFPELASLSPLKEELVQGVDFLILRELVGGIYFGTPRGIEKSGRDEKGINTEVYTTPEIKRIAHKAFEFARKRSRRVTCVDKSNVLESSQLWRRVVTEVGKEYADVTLDYRYVDDCAMQLVKNPKAFDVIVTTNLFGDILSDEAAVLTGSIGMLPSASVGEHHALYEPVHGSAPDIAGRDIANPLGTILSAAMMMEFSFGLAELAKSVERAVELVIREGCRTADLYQPGMTRVSCSNMGDLVAGKIR